MCIRDRDKYDKADGVKLSCIQFLTSGILSGILMLIFDKADINSIMKAIIPILYAGVMSSGIAYTFQIIGQKYAKPSVTAIVLSLESVFAALAGDVYKRQEQEVQVHLANGLPKE